MTSETDLVGNIDSLWRCLTHGQSKVMMMVIIIITEVCLAAVHFPSNLG